MELLSGIIVLYAVATTGTVIGVYAWSNRVTDNIVQFIEQFHKPRKNANI